jgi:hypothetical protein
MPRNYRLRIETAGAGPSPAPSTKTVDVFLARLRNRCENPMKGPVTAAKKNSAFTSAAIGGSI